MMLSGSSVSPTYCKLQCLHVTRYSTFPDLQKRYCSILYLFPFTMLLNMLANKMYEQKLQRSYGMSEGNYWVEDLIVWNVLGDP